MKVKFLTGDGFAVFVKFNKSLESVASRQMLLLYASIPAAQLATCELFFWNIVKKQVSCPVQDEPGLYVTVKIASGDEIHCGV